MNQTYPSIDCILLSVNSFQLGTARIQMFNKFCWGMAARKTSATDFGSTLRNTIQVKEERFLPVRIIQQGGSGTNSAQILSEAAHRNIHRS